MMYLLLHTLTYAQDVEVSSVIIPAGTYTMGCDTVSKRLCFKDEYPSHRVTLTQSHQMMTHEVTQGLYQSIMGSNPSHYQKCGMDCPVEQTTWFDAVRFANALSAKMGLSQCYNINQDMVEWNNTSCTGWRLPTEAEWEYAARGNESYMYAGSNTITDVASTGRKKQDYVTYPVCSFQKNGFGLCDMSGNVFEWVWDTYTNYDSSTQIDPAVFHKENLSRVRRGGARCDFAKHCRVSIRYGSYATFRYKYQGFRLVRAVVTDSQ